MKKFVFPLIGLLIIIGSLVFLVIPLEVEVPKITIQANSGQEEFAKSLEIGNTFEMNGDYDRAIDYYEEAAKSDQVEIRNLAFEGISRIEKYKQNILVSLQSGEKNILSLLVQNVLYLLPVVLFIGLFWIIFVIVPHTPGYLIQPFDDYTKEDLGKSFSIILNNSIQEVIDNFQPIPNSVLLSIGELEIPSFSLQLNNQEFLSTTVGSLDTYTIPGINLPFGNVIAGIYQFLHKSENRISGSIHSKGGKVFILAKVNSYKSSVPTKHWNITSLADGEISEQIYHLADQLAYQIIFDVCDNLEANNWSSFQSYSESIKLIRFFQNKYPDPLVLENAYSLLSKVVASEPNFTSATFLLAITSLYKGSYSESRDLFKRVVSDGNNLVAEAMYYLGLAYYHEFKDWAHKQAITHFASVIDAIKTEATTENQKLLLALSHCGIANAYAQIMSNTISQNVQTNTEDEQLRLVKEHFNCAISISESPQVVSSSHNALGLALYKAGHLDEAENAIKTAIKSYSQNPIFYINLSLISEAKKDIEEAISNIKSALRLKPNYDYAYFRLGNLYSAQDKYSESKEAYRQAQSISDAYNNMGEILAKEGDYDGAIHSFLEAVKLNKENARAYGNLGWWIIESGKRDEQSINDAMKYARHSLDLRRGSDLEWLCHDTIGNIYIAMELYDEAKKELELSINLNCNKIQNHYHLANLFFLTPEISLSKAELITALKQQERGFWREKAEGLMLRLKNYR